MTDIHKLSGDFTRSLHELKTDRQRAFVAARLSGMTARASARKAGFIGAGSRTRAYRLSRNPNVVRSLKLGEELRAREGELIRAAHTDLATLAALRAAAA